MKTERRSVAEFIGKPIEHAEKYVRPVRVVSEDGKSYIVSKNMRPNRLNVKLIKGIVVDAYWG